MPIPGDNGNPKAERDAQEKRIREESVRGGNVKKDVRVIGKDPMDKSIFGEMHK